MQSQGLDDDVKERLEPLAKELIRLHIEVSGKPEIEWSLSDWKNLAFDLAVDSLARHRRLKSKFSVAKHFFEHYGKKHEKKLQQDKDRIKNRPDQVDKRAFQKAVLANYDVYTTKADAIRDLKIKPQFEDYPDNTLRNWLKDIWEKPIAPGRPKKVKE